MALLILFLLLITPLSSPSTQLQFDLLHLDRVARDCAFRSYSAAAHHKTAVVFNVSLPPELAGVTTGAVRYRSGSLRRYGASFENFDIAPGVFVHPHSKRLILVIQNLGNLSSAYGGGFRNLSGYRIVSPVLGLLFYRETEFQKVGDILVTRRPIMINFSGLVAESSPGRRPRRLCAFFEQDGGLSLSNQTRPDVCSTRLQGHFALVEEEEGSKGGGDWRRPSRWKLVAAGVSTGVFVAVLLGLVVVAVVAVRRKRLRNAEMERRAYEDEALQVAIVGHVRAPTAAAARTAPTLEDGDSPCL